MRLNLGEKVHFEVMSSSDSSLHATVSSTATHNTENSSPAAKPSETSDEGNGNASVQRDSMVIQLSNSSSDLEGQDSSLHILSSNSEVNDQSAYDEGLDPLKKDNAKSAFAITSVRPASDDHDRSVARNPVSTDSLRETLIGAKTDDSIVASEKQPNTSSTDLGDSVAPTVQAHFQVGSPKEEEDQPTGVAEEVATPSTTSINPTQNSTTLQEDPTTPAHPSNASSSMGGAGGGVIGGAIAGNGTSVQPNRFRRVNQYERGRWTVRDSFVTEEQAETTLAATGDSNTGSTTITQSTKHLANNVKESDVVAIDTEGLANGSSPKIPHQQQDHTPVSVTSTDSATVTTELGNLPGNSGGGGGGNLGPLGGGTSNAGLNDTTSDRDSSSVHMDRSSTAAETLSRNTSMSSIVPEKSIDGDDLLHDSEVESVSGGVAGGGGGGGGLAMNSHPHNQDQDLEELPVSSSSSTQPPFVLTSSVGAISSPSVTTVLRHYDHAPLVTSSHSDIRKESEGEVDLQRVKNAMSLLQDELQLVLTSTSNASLLEENKSLKERVVKLEEENSKLRKLEDENTGLKKELKHLRDSLAFLVQSGPTESSQQTSQEGAPSNNESSKNSQSQEFT